MQMTDGEDADLLPARLAINIAAVVLYTMRIIIELFDLAVGIVDDDESIIGEKHLVIIDRLRTPDEEATLAQEQALSPVLAFFP